MLKIPRAKAKAHFPKKLAFINSKCLAQDAFGESLRTIENFLKSLAVREQLCAQIFLFSRIFDKAILINELNQLPRCIAPDK